MELNTDDVVAADCCGNGTGVIGGMLMSTMISTFFVPLFFVLLETWSEKWSKKSPKEEKGDSTKANEAKEH